MNQSEQVFITTHYLIETWQELVNCLSKNADKIYQHQMHYWQDHYKLYQDLCPTVEEVNDKRFKIKEWQNSVLFNFIKRSYLLISKHIDNTINDVIQSEDKAVANKLRFLTKQFIDANSPTNFAGLNPEVISKIADTHGENLITGYKNLLEDIQQGRGLFNIKLTDHGSFKIGGNIACTPGKIVFQNDIMQLIQYTASTKKVYSYPLLIIPPWINKYYILDLRSENSFVKWLVDQGITVFMISWVNPSAKQREKKFSDYMHEGPLQSLKIIKKITNENKFNVLGYCVGGTLLGCTLAYLAQKKDSRINSATFLTTLFDFSEPGELGTFTDEKQINMVEKIMQSKGYLDGNIMTAIFNSLRVNDLIWSAFVNQYLKGQKPKAYDLLYWNSDSTHLPERLHSFYLRNMYLENNMVQPGKIILSGVAIDLGKISVPSYFLAAQDDHIVPWQSCFKGMQNFKGKTKFVLTTSGHVAGVVNPPCQNKYGYWINNENQGSAAEYLEGASFQNRSWWNDWIVWLKKFSGKSQSARQLNLKDWAIVENAPGSYVQVHLSDIV